MIKLIVLLTIGSVICVPETSTPQQTVNFLKALEINSNNHTIYYYEGKGFGLKLQTDVSSGDIVIKSSPALSLVGITPYAFSPYLKGLSSHIKLIGRIIYEKFMAPRGQFLTEYVHQFPVIYNTPHSFTDAELDLLDKISLFKIPRSFLFKNLAEDHVEFVKRVGKLIGLPKEVLVWETFMWADSTLRSRAYGLPKDMAYNLFNINPDDDYSNEESFSVLISILDIPNHGVVFKNPKDFIGSLITTMKPAPAFALRAYKNYSAGSEFFFEYRKLSNNLILFRDYGFVIQKNLRDFIVINLRSKLCFESLTKDQENCEYYLYPDHINKSLLKYLSTLVLKSMYFELDEGEDVRDYYVKTVERNQDKAFIKTLVSYRAHVNVNLKSKESLRQINRDIKKAQNKKEELIYEFAAAVRKTAYEHIKLVDRDLIHILSKDLYLS